MTYTVSSGTLNSSIPYHTLMCFYYSAPCHINVMRKICCSQLYASCSKLIHILDKSKLFAYQMNVVHLSLKFPLTTYVGLAI